MKLFITGGTGFIGKRVLDQLAGSIHELTCFVRSANPQKEILRGKGIRVVEGDVRDKEALLKGMKGSDCVINLANVYTMWEPDNTIYWSVNVNGTRNVLESVLENKIPKVLHVSSMVAFGKPAEIPFNETCNPGPRMFSRYAHSKYEGDKVAWDLYKNNGLPLVMIYPAAVLGDSDPKATGSYIRKLVGKKLPATVAGTSVFTWVHVNDVAAAIIKAAEKPGNIGEKYLIGKYRYTFDEFNRMISDVSGVSLPQISMPDLLLIPSSYLMTGIANLIKKPPLLEMSVSQMRTMVEGFAADGSKAEKELGITYTPIRVAIEDELKKFVS